MRIRKIFGFSKTTTAVLLVLAGTLSLLAAGSFTTPRTASSAKDSGATFKSILKNYSTRSFSLGISDGPTVVTDKADYPIGATVVISGSGWQPGETVTLQVTDDLSATDPNHEAHTPWDVVADASGNISSTWTVDADADTLTLTLTATGTVSGNTSTTFTDANPSASLDQCANGQAPSPSTDGCDADASDWVSGNLGASKSFYREGDSIAYRMVFQNLATGGGNSHSVTIEWDTTKAGKHAIDYITTFNRTVADADPCLGIPVAHGDPSCGAASTFAIPKDPQVDNGSGSPISQIPGLLTLYGGTITSVSAPTSVGSTSCSALTLGKYCYSTGPGFSGDKSAAITVNFTASQSNPVLAWGGHIATRANWGINNSAIAISGSPYHTRLIDLDGSGGNQDRSLSADAVFFPVQLTIVKETNPDKAPEHTFSYTTTGADLSGFSLTPPDGTTPDSKIFNLNDGTTRTVTETDPGPDFSFTSLDCSSIDGGLGTSTPTISGRTATINPVEGEFITCTYVNTSINDTFGRIIVSKVTDPSPDTNMFTFNPVGFPGTSTFTSSFNLQNGDSKDSCGVGVNCLAPSAGGLYKVTETADSNYTTTANCTSSEVGRPDSNPAIGIPLEGGETVTCTFTNTKKATIIVKKHMIGGTDTFAFTGDPNGSINTDNGTISETVVPGTYTSTETLKSGWDLNSVSCDDSDSNGSVPNHNAVFHAAAGETITCTFTNTKQATIIVKKHMIGGTDTFGFTGDPNGSISTDNGTISENVVPGTYTSTETLKTGWDLNSVSCDDSDSAGSVPNHNAVFHAAAGETVTCTFTNTKEATIIVKKHMIGGTDTFAFTGDPSGSINTDNGTVQESVVPGTYTSTETLKSGWDLNSVSCDDSDSLGSVPNHNAEFHVAAGETVTCTFTNTKEAAIIVKKHMVGGTSTFSFTGDPNGSISTDNGTIQESVVPGTYTSTETLKTGWDLNSVSCDDSDSLGSVANHNAEFHVAAGETVTCTFTNTKEATIIVKKHMIGGTDTFSFTGDPNGSISTDNGTIQESVVPGTYTSTETLVTGWDLNSVICDDSDSVGSVANHNTVFHAAAGETVTCTFTNTRRATIIVKKHMVGGTDTFAFTGDPSGSISTDNGTISESVAPGTYTSTETPKSGWDLNSVTCDDSDSVGSVSSHNSAFHAAAGETVTCTFTNTKRGLAKVVKTFNGLPLSGTDSFTFQLRSGASDSAAGTIVETGTANAANSGVINFSTTLVPGQTYQLCEQMQPGWLTTLGPPLYSVFNPSGDNSVVCTDFTVSAGETKEFDINNQPPPGGMGLTIGFWKNWASCAKSSGGQKPTTDRTLQLGDIVLGSLTLHDSNPNPDVASDCQAVVNLLNKTTISGGKKMASDPIFNMVAQLVAADLNVLAGAGQSVNAMAARNCAHALLAAIHFDGTKYDKLTAAQIAQANCLATALDQYNNNEPVQACSGC
jgi:hypothetical protein